MYQVGTYVMKANKGICQIQELSQQAVVGFKKQLCYTIVPKADPNLRIYVPVEPEPTTLRPILTEQEARDLIGRIPQIELPFIENERQREQNYRTLLRCNDPEKTASVVKCIYARTAEGKRQTAMDKTYFRTAEDYLYSELAMALGKERDEIPKLIEAAVAGKEFSA